MISLVVKAGDSGTDFYGKKGSELQSGITISGTKISGTLLKTTDYHTFGGDTANHHLVLSLASDNAEKIETKMTGGSLVMQDYVTVTDGYCVYSVTEKDTQKIYVKGTKGVDSDEKIYDLSGLTLGD